MPFHLLLVLIFNPVLRDVPRGSWETSGQITLVALIKKLYKFCQLIPLHYLASFIALRIARLNSISNNNSEHI